MILLFIQSLPSLFSACCHCFAFKWENIKLSSLRAHNCSTKLYGIHSFHFVSFLPVCVKSNKNLLSFSLLTSSVIPSVATSNAKGNEHKKKRGTFRTNWKICYLRLFSWLFNMFVRRCHGRFDNWNFWPYFDQFGAWCWMFAGVENDFSDIFFREKEKNIQFD